MKTAFRTWQSTADKRERNIMTIHKSVSELIGGTQRGAADQLGHALVDGHDVPLSLVRR